MGKREISVWGKRGGKFWPAAKPPHNWRLAALLPMALIQMRPWLFLIGRIIERYQQHPKAVRLGVVIEEVGLEQFKKDVGAA
jgi:dissimilatory sulfite reductase (desulfoviridin) alpha/beta subunit